MMVLVATACPPGLRGDLTKWLLEISPGVFVGKPSARIREKIWERTVELCRDGRAILVHSSDNEQGLDFRIHRHDWTPTDYEGVTLIKRPTAPSRIPTRTGWSKARNFRRNSRRAQP